MLALALLASLAVGGPAAAQNRYDGHKLEDRFYITLGGFWQFDMRSSVRLDAKVPGGNVILGTLIALERQFDLEDDINIGRLDGGYRFNERHRIGWTFWNADKLEKS